jgi:hypothetical protein
VIRKTYNNALVELANDVLSLEVGADEVRLSTVSFLIWRANKMSFDI